MTPERWKKVEELYQAALVLHEIQRDRFLVESCHGDEELRREVESLLAYQGKVESFIEAPERQPQSMLGPQTVSLTFQGEALLGQTLSHYHILEKLGEGGMGVVYKARDTHLDRFVAVKVLPRQKVADVERKRRFVQEAKAASARNHPNIITIYDINQANGIDFIAMEYVDGKTLDQLIPRRGLRLNEALKYAIQIADALVAAHAAGIVHRDLKPSNVIVTESGLVKILDFGLAKLTERQNAVEEKGSAASTWADTEPGTVMGTVSYMSPEQAEGKVVDARSDIFSFGSLLYEMVTGRRAFQGDSVASTLAAILDKDPKPVSELVEDVPRDLEKIINRCLRKDPSRRIQYVVDLQLALEEQKEDSDSGKLTLAAPRLVARRRNLTWIPVLLIALFIGGVVLWRARFTNKAPEAPLTAVPLTSYVGSEKDPTFSPDGNQVAFSWDGEKQDNFDIYVKLIGTGPPLRLTTNPAEDSSPAWSPDGRSIAFLRSLSDGKAAVMLVPPIQGPERKVAEIFGPVFALGGPYLAWTSDNKSLVTIDRESTTGPVGLFLLTIETGQKIRLTSPPEKSVGDSGPAFSPDGRTLAFSRWIRFFHSNLSLLSFSGDMKPIGEPRVFSVENRERVSPAWTPDGHEIIFSSPGFGGPSLWRIAASGPGEPQPLATLGEDGYSPAISRQGRRLVYTRRIADTNIWRIKIPGPNDKASPPMLFISSTLPERASHFSPDGKRIAFCSQRSGSNESGYATRMVQILYN